MPARRQNYQPPGDRKQRCGQPNSNAKVKLRRQVTTIVAVALIAFQATSRAEAQIAEHYRGAARNSADPHSPASLELSMFSRNDTLSTGWLAIGQPLVGSGITAAIRQGPDSIVL